LIILRLLFLFLTSLAWHCENLFAHQSSPSPSYSPHHCPFTPVEPGHGVDLYEDGYLLLLAEDLRMDPSLRPRPVSSVAFATSVTLTTQPLDSTTAYLQSIGFPLRHPLDYTNRNVVFDSTYTAEYLTTQPDDYLHVEHMLHLLFLFLISLALRCENLFAHQSSPSYHIPISTAPSLRWSLAMGMIITKTIIYFSLRQI
jgi:hypothetical protein